MKKIMVSFLKLTLGFLLFLGFISYMARDKPRTTAKKEIKTQVVTQEEIEKLEDCAEEMLNKNLDLMEEPAVGNWKMLNNIEIEVEDTRIEVTYYVNSLFTDEKRSGLDKMQKVFAKQAGCSSSVVRTAAQ